MAILVQGRNWNRPRRVIVGIAALFTGLTAAAAGMYLLAVWLIEYDREFQGAATTRLPVPVISAHALLAVTGLVLWMIYLFLNKIRLAWAAAIVLSVVAILGLIMAARWIGVYRATPPARRATAAADPISPRAALMIPPERNFPLSVVIGHGVLAVTTLVLVILTALGVGRS